MGAFGPRYYNPVLFLDKAEYACEIFDQKKDECIKVILKAI